MDAEILVVGAGPSGLVLANVLADHGVDFRIVDRKPGPVRQSRAAIVHVRTLELLDRLGLADEAIRRGVPTTHVEVYERGRPAAEFPLPHALILEQDKTEELLIEALRDHGKRVEWDTELLDLTDGPTARLRRPDGTEETVRPRWLVAADGAASPVRHALGLGFAGKTYDQTGLLADVELDLPTDTRLEPGTLRLNLTRGGFVGMVGFSNGRHRLFGALPRDFAAQPADADETISHESYATTSLADLQRWFDEYFFVRATIRHAEWTALFRIHSRIAERFRAGNVFLVGDAAHIHSPAGGQGMNLGIGDAFNLAWKLALVAKGHAKPALLDTYETERHPVARKVLSGSDRGFALEATPSPLAGWARAHLAPHLLRPLLRLPAVRAAIGRLFSQTWISYRTSRLGPRPRPGDRAPAAFDLVGGTRHSLLLFGAGTYRPAVEAVLRSFPFDVSVRVVPGTKPDLVLIRPDGHVAYRGSPVNTAGLAAYLAPLYPQIRP